MDKFIVETSLQFPVFKLTELVSFSEVKKPSGVAYIILVLIKDSKQRKSRLADVLVNFGVPERLHHLFLNAINDLLRQQLITSDFGNHLDPKGFKDCRVSSFSFTEKGEKIFADGYIPATDEYGNPIEKETKVEIFYDIALNSFCLKLPDNLEGRPLKDAPIGPEFFERFSVRKNEEDFMNLSKGASIGIKKEEVITGVETQIRENWTVKYDCSIQIDGDKAQIHFDEKALQEFFERNYDPKIVTSSILFKNKFHFLYSDIPSLRLSQFPESSIRRILIPKDLNEIAKQKTRLTITKGNYGGEGFVLKTNESLPFDAEFLHVNAQGQTTAYVPARFAFDVDGFGTIEIPLALELIVEQQELQKTLLPIVFGLSSFSSEHFEKLVRISECSKDYDIAFKMMEQYLSPLDNIHKIGVLSEMRPYSLQSPSIAAKQRELTAKVYEDYIGSIEEADLETALKVTSWIPKYLGISSKNVLDLAFRALGEVNNTIDVFRLFAEAKYDEALICSYVNPVPESLRRRNVTHPSLVSLVSFDNSLHSLKQISGINDLLHFGIDEESLDKITFRSVYAMAVRERKNLQPFEEANKGLFEEYDGFMKLFGCINDDINMFESALKNPNSIQSEVIERKINAGEFQYVFVNLSGKLESILKTKFGLNGTLSDMLSEARKQQLINKDIVSDLHDFREARNANVHIDAPRAAFVPSDLRRWSKEIFELEEGKDE